MKKIKSIFSIIMYLGITLFISSCSDTPSILEVVPKTAPTVSVINVSSLLKKGHLYDIKEFKFFKKIKRLANEDAEMRKVYKAIEEDPTSTGVDFLGDLVIFNHAVSKEKMYSCIAFELSNSDDFEKFILDSFGKTKQKFDIKEKDGLNYVVISDSRYTKITLSWDDSKALFTYSNSFRDSEKGTDEDVFIGLMNLKAEDNITTNENFSKFIADRKDVSTWSSLQNYKILMKDAPQFGLLSMFLGSNVKGLDSDKDKSPSIFDKELYFSSHLDFDNEFIKYSGGISPKDSLKEFDFYNKDFNADILKYIPKESYFTAGMSLDVSKAHDYLGTHKEYLEIMEKMAEELKIDGKALINSFGGSAVFNVHGVDELKYSYLGYGYSFDESKAKKLDKLYAIHNILSVSEKEKLNRGETISVNAGLYSTSSIEDDFPISKGDHSGKYSINIKNVLAKGGSVETAEKNNTPINYYDGGMEYGRNVEKTFEKELPLYAFVTDIKDSKIITELFNSEEFTKEDGYYKTKGEDLAYISMQENTLLITNDIKVIEKHKTGGFSDNLGTSSLASNISSSSFYASMNFDYDTYSDKVKNSLESKFKKGFTEKPYSLVFGFIKTIELKTTDKTNAEFIINTQNTDENSFYNLIKTIDDGTSSFY